MRCYHYNLMTSCVLLLWCFAVALVLSLKATAVLAAPTCDSSCSNIFCCPGCQPAWVAPPPTNNQVQAGWIIVPDCTNSMYNACNAGPINSLCVASQVSCFIVPPGGVKFVLYPNGTCSGQGNIRAVGPFYVIKDGCRDSVACQS